MLEENEERLRLILAFATEKGRVCPTPNKWSELWGLLPNRERVGSGWKPAVPLILGAWWESSGREKSKRLALHLAWAADHDALKPVERFLRGLSEEEWLHQGESAAGSGGGSFPVWGEQFHEPTERPLISAAAAAIENLARDWSGVVGDQLASVTRPVRFTGRKLRRLVVVADPGASPPWGSWFSTHKNPTSFRAFRAAINDSIAPMQVDHVDFIFEKWSREAE